MASGGGRDGESGPDDKRTSHRGRVEEAQPNAQFLIRLEDGRVVRAMVARASRAVLVKVQPGESVEVELYPYDPTRGTILRKLS